jgi:cell division transport system ATP-binding protein
VIEFSHVFQNYGQPVNILTGVSFRIEPREFVFLLGPSGAGKTTVLRHIYMQDIPSRGVVTVENFTSSRVTPPEKTDLRRRLGIVFQDFRLLPDRNVLENVAFPLHLQGLDQAYIQRRGLKLLAETGIANKATENVTRLSAGEKQRVCIARALVNDPIILLADEPLANLDPANAVEIFKLLMHINAGGTAVLMASHRLDLLEQNQYRAIRLEGGRVVSREFT